MSCQHRREKIDFYKDEIKYNQFWRFPIIEPYELVTSDKLNGKWNLNWDIENEEKYFFPFNADSINFQNNYISLFSNSGIYNLNIIDIKLKRCISIPDRDSFLIFCKKHELKPIFYEFNDIYKKWLLTKQLPWRVADNLAKPGPTSSQ